MPGFLYFLPNADGISSEQLAKSPIGYAFTHKESFAKTVVANGPSNTPGLVVCATSRVSASKCKYLPKEQVWFHNKAENYWVGKYADDSIHSSDLERPEMLAGNLIELLDGGHWLAPTARRWANVDQAQGYEVCEVVLPRILEWDGSDGYFYGRVIDKHAKLWAICQAVFNTRCDGETAEEYVSSEQEREAMKGSGPVFAAIHALQANYFIGPAECNMLGLFDETSPSRILSILCDWDNYLKVREKKRLEILAGLSFSNGQQETSPAIDQQCSTAPA